MNKLTDDFQRNYADKQFMNEDVLKGISGNVKLHDEIKNVRSSAAVCLNVMGYLNQHNQDIIPFFSQLGLNLNKVIDFPSGMIFDGESYDDQGPIVFEWIGPKKSPINEKGGSRGQNKTSIDAYFLAEINGKITQIFIEWKFTEQYNSESDTHKFGGKKGIERLRRYSGVLVQLRKKEFPFRFNEEDKIGLTDFSYEPFYQLLRMTLLAKKTTPVKFDKLDVEDYKIVHLSHSSNTGLNILSENHLKYSPGLTVNTGNSLHDTWISLLEKNEKQRHVMAYWDKALPNLSDNLDKKYLVDRYYEEVRHCI